MATTAISGSTFFSFSDYHKAHALNFSNLSILKIINFALANYQCAFKVLIIIFRIQWLIHFYFLTVFFSVDMLWSVIFPNTGEGRDFFQVWSIIAEFDVSIL